MDIPRKPRNGDGLSRAELLAVPVVIDVPANRRDPPHAGSHCANIADLNFVREAASTRGAG